MPPAPLLNKALPVRLDSPGWGMCLFFQRPALALRRKRAWASVLEHRQRVVAHEKSDAAWTETIRSNESKLREQRKNGDLEGLPAQWIERLNTPGPLSAQEWSELAKAAHQAVRATDQMVVQGHRAAHQLMAKAAAHATPRAGAGVQNGDVSGAQAAPGWNPGWLREQRQRPQAWTRRFDARGATADARPRALSV